MSSISSLIFNDIVHFRNPADGDSVACGRVLITEVAMVVALPIALLETIFSNIARIFACLPLGEQTCQQIHAWGSSSATALICTLAAIVFNACARNLIPIRDVITSSHTVVDLTQSSSEPPAPIMIPPPSGSSLPPQSPVAPLPLPIIPPLGPQGIRPPASIGPSPLPGTPSVALPPAPPKLPKASEIDASTLPPLDPTRAALYAQYEFGENATKVSEIAKKLDSNLPNPTLMERSQLKDAILGILGFSTQDLAMNADAQGIAIKLDLLLDENKIMVDKYKKAMSPEWKDRAVRMLWGIWVGYQALIEETEEADSERLCLKLSLKSGLTHCSARMSTEIENSYYRLAGPQAMGDLASMRSPTECLISDLTQYRMELRDAVINEVCKDQHNASSHKYYRTHLNESSFYLPKPPLSDEDPNWDTYALKEKAAALTKKFHQLYNYQTVIQFFEERVLKDKGFRFDKQLFVTWLEDSGKMNEDAFEDEDMTSYHPERIVEFLEELGFIHKKG